VLAQSLIDRDIPKANGRTTCYFFFKDDDPEQRSASNALCAILHQLFCDKKALLKHVVTDFSEVGQAISRHLPRLWRILIRAAKDPIGGEIICIFDGLDECEEADLDKLIRLMVDFYENTISERETTVILKFLITSRRYQHIERKLSIIDRSLRSIHLSDSGMIIPEIDLFIHDETSKIGVQLMLEEKVRQEMEDELKKVENRTYLWVHLILDVIRNSVGKTQTRSLRRLIHTLPDSVSSAYENILGRASDPERAVRTLQIILSSRRPLTVGEMNHALAIDTRVSQALEPEEDDDHFKYTIRNQCGLFIDIAESNKIYLTHDTARDFLLSDKLTKANDRNLRFSQAWGLPLKMQDSHQSLAKVCITYLSTGTWFDALSEDELYLPLLVKVDEVPFLHYAAHNWAYHVSQGSEGIFQVEILEFLSQSSRIDFLLHLIWLNELSRDYWTSAYKAPLHSSPIMVASFFGLERVVRVLIEDPTSLDSRSSQGATALQWAVWQDEKSIVQILHTAGADLNARDEEHNTSLHVAALKGHSVLLDQLLDLGIAIDKQNKTGHTALHIAAANGHNLIVISLLNRGADTLIYDIQRRNVLHHAIDNQRLSIDIETIRLLLEHSVVSEEADINNMTPLHLAVKCNQGDVVSLLLDHGVSIDLPIERKFWSGRMEDGHIYYSLQHPAVQDFRLNPLFAGYNPLHAAALFGKAAMVHLLLDRGANPNAHGEHGETPLHLALTAGMGKRKIEDAWTDPINYVEDTLDMIVDHLEDDNKEAYEYVHKMREDTILALLKSPELDVIIQDACNRTLLHVIQYGHCEGSEYVTRILERGSDSNVRDNKGRTAVHRAARAGDHKSLNVFLRYQADPFMTDDLGQNLLHHACASRRGRESVQTISLLRHIAGPVLLSSRDGQGQNCLHHAVSQFADIDLVRFLIVLGVDVNHPDDQGHSPMMTAIVSAPFSCQRDVLRVLLEAGADPRVTDNAGKNLIHLLMSHGDFTETETLDLLADHNISINAIDRKGRTVLHHAAIAGTLSRPILYAILKRWNLDVNARDNDQRTALDYAIVEAGLPRHPELFDTGRWHRSRDLLREVGADEPIP